MVVKDLCVYYGKFPAEGTQVSFLAKISKMIRGKGMFFYLHKGTFVGTVDLAFQQL